MSRLFFLGRVVTIFALSSTLLVAANLKRRTISGEYLPPSDGDIKVAFLDADWTLRISKSGRFTSITPEDAVILPHVAQRIRELNAAGYLVAMVSNQLEVPGELSPEQAERNFLGTVDALERLGARIDYFDFGEASDPLSLKPNPTMGLRLNAELERRFGRGVDTRESFMVGDAGFSRDDIRPDGTPGSDFSNVDRKFAENLNLAGLGRGYFEPNDFFDWQGIQRFMTLDVLDKYNESHTECASALEALAAAM